MVSTSSGLYGLWNVRRYCIVRLWNIIVWTNKARRAQKIKIKHVRISRILSPTRRENARDLARVL